MNPSEARSNVHSLIQSPANNTASGKITSTAESETLTTQTGLLTQDKVPLITPVTERTSRVSTHGEISRFDCLMLTSDEDLQRVLASQQLTAGAETLLISDPDNLTCDGLLQRVTIHDDGRHQIRPGKLFEYDQKLTVVVDLRTLPAKKIALFNDLLDPDDPCLYNPKKKEKSRIGSHVRVLTIITPNQLTENGSKALPPDCLRRVNRSENSWDKWAGSIETELPHANLLQLLPQHNTPQVSIEDHLPEELANPSPVTIDLHLHANWRHLLYGGPGMDDKGRVRHLTGVLNGLMPNQSVIFKGADRAGPEFHQAVRHLIEKRTFESNGNTCQLAEGICFFQCPVSCDDLQQLSESIESISSPPDQPILINQVNLAQWLAPIRINHEGLAVPNTTLEEQIRAGGTVTITSYLTESEWFMLLGRLKTLADSGIKPVIFVACPDGQPVQFCQVGAEGCEAQLCDKTPVLAHRYREERLALDSALKEHPDALIIRTNALTLPGQLFDHLHITSEKEPRFGRLMTQLQKALEQGRPVIVQGLHDNPELQYFLESLCCQPARVMINGVIHTYPKANIVLLWPEGKESRSPLWKSLIKRSHEPMEIDLWEQAETRHKLEKGTLPVKAIDRLYQAFATLPGYIVKKTGPLPALTPGLLDNLIVAARLAADQDRADRLFPRHWRKAINSVLTHRTRYHREARDFMKAACAAALPDPSGENWVDVEQLTDKLPTSQEWSTDFVETHYWQLARCFGSDAFPGCELQFIQLATKTMTDLLNVYILKNNRQPITFRNRKVPALTSRSTRRIKIIEDALGSGWSVSPDFRGTRTELIQSLTTYGLNVAQMSGQDLVSRHSMLEQLLNDQLIWHGAGPKPLKKLAASLLSGTVNQASRERRRLNRLKFRLEKSPLIFIEGETGTGKSFFSANVANETGQAFIVSIGPTTSEQDLAQKWVWRPHPENTEDRCLSRQKKILLKWAESQPEKQGDWVTLVIDEANLAPKGLLTSLDGLWNKHPCIYVDGQPVSLTSSHRIILTGNPSSYEGRHMDACLLAQAQQIVFPPLNEVFLHDRVTVPALANQLTSHCPGLPEAESLALNAAERTMVLLKHYKRLLPDHGFTPRDLTDICAWMGWNLRQSIESGLMIATSITIEQLNALIWQGFRDALDFEVQSLSEDALASLDIWFRVKYPVSQTLLDNIQQQALRYTRPYWNDVATAGFDTSSPAVAELIRALEQDLSRCQQAWESGQKHGGRQATLIEGPTGRGKDATLRLAINSFHCHIESRHGTFPRVYDLSACNGSWDAMFESIQQARSEGGIVLFSEMNLVDSAILENHLNDALAGDAHPGFHLFATINPATSSGRNPLSPALEGRFRRLPVRGYSQDELTGIARRWLPQTEAGRACGARLADGFCRLRQQLEQSGSAFRPTIRELRTLIRQMDFTHISKTDEAALFQNHFWPYLKAANTDLQQLMAMPVPNHRQVFDRSLSQWLHQAVPNLEAPWRICRGPHNSLNSDSYEIVLNENLDVKEAQLEITRLLAQRLWKASELPLSPPEPTNTLTQSMYLFCQRLWFSHCFGSTGISPDQVFMLTEVQALTLALDANQPYLQAVIYEMTNLNPESPNDYQKAVQATLNRPVASLKSHLSIPEQLAPAVRIDAPAWDIDKTLMDISYSMDDQVDFQNEPVPERDVERIFNCNLHPGFYRRHIYDIELSGNSGLQERSAGLGEYGLEAVIPGKLATAGTLALDPKQTYGMYSLSQNDLDALESGHWIDLYGLHCHEQITSLSVFPESPCQVLRDRYTGLHKLYLPERVKGQQYTLHYIVERVDSTEPALQERPDLILPQTVRSAIDELFSKPVFSSLPDTQQQDLIAINKAHSPTKRVNAIVAYCGAFKGERRPEAGEDLFVFLLRNRQGSCRHRVPVFVALCRYFGIAARISKSTIHSYGEFSLDLGKNWQAADLGGSPAKLNMHVHNYPETVPGQTPFSQSSKSADILKKMSPKQQAALARAYGVSPEALKKALDTGTGLAIEALPDQYDVVRKLFKTNDWMDFKTGCQLVASQESPKNDEEVYALRKLLYIDWTNTVLCDTAANILAAGENIDQVLELLTEFHRQVIGSPDAPNNLTPVEWHHCMVKMLWSVLCAKGASHPVVISTSKYVLNSGWLISDAPIRELETDYLFNVLNRLAAVDELKPQIRKQCLALYRQLFAKPLRTPTVSSEPLITWDKETMSGSSPLLESTLKTPFLTTSWTEQPEGIPDIERLLSGHPAFRIMRQGHFRHRPVILLSGFNHFRDKKGISGQLLGKLHSEVFRGRYSAMPTSFNEPDILRWQSTLSWPHFNSQQLQEQERQKNRIESLLQSLFIDYLYQTMNSHHGQLIFCCARVCEVSHCGSYRPASSGELEALMRNYATTPHQVDKLDSPMLQAALQVSNALVLDDNILRTIATEFIDSLQLEALYKQMKPLVQSEKEQESMFLDEPYWDS